MGVEVGKNELQLNSNQSQRDMVERRGEPRASKSNDKIEIPMITSDETLFPYAAIDFPPPPPSPQHPHPHLLQSDMAVDTVKRYSIYVEGEESDQGGQKVLLFN